MPDDDFYVSWNAVFSVDGDCELVQVNEGFVICDGIDPGFVVFPWAYCEGHVFLNSVLVGDGGDNLGDEVAVFGLVFFAEGRPADEIVEKVPGIGTGVCVVCIGVRCRGFGEGIEVFFGFVR